MFTLDRCSIGLSPRYGSVPPPKKNKRKQTYGTFSGALGLVNALLIRHGLAHLLRHLLHNVGALLLGGGSTLLLGHISGHGGALLLGVGGALLPRLGPGLGHAGGEAHALSDGRADLDHMSI